MNADCTEKSVASELVYQQSNGILDCILKKYPHAQIEDASDYVHEERFQVTIQNVTQKDFWVFSIVEGFSDVCLDWKLKMGGARSAKERNEVKSIIEEALKMLGENKA